MAHQQSLDRSMVVAPPEKLHPSFYSPRSRNGRNSASDSAGRHVPPLEDSAQETIEQKYLRNRISNHPKHDPNMNKDIQLKSISKRYLSSSEGKGPNLSDILKNKSQPASYDDSSESFGERMTSLRNLKLLHNTSRGALSNFSIGESAGSTHDGGSLGNMAGRVEDKAMKKVKWLENYIDICEKQKISKENQDVARAREVLDKFNKLNNDGEISEPQISPTLGKTISVGLEQDANEEEQSDIGTLKKQLVEAQREIAQLKLEKELLHTKNEIKKLKTEISYSREKINEDLNINNVLKSEATTNHTPAEDVKTGRDLSIDSRPSTLPNAPVSTPLETPSPTSLTTTAISRDNINNVNETTDNSSIPLNKKKSMRKSMRAAARASMRKSKVGSNGLVAMKGRGTMAWSKIANTVVAEGSEAFVGDDEYEAYVEEKKRRKQIKKFMAEIGESDLGFRNNEKKVNPIIAKQAQSAGFLKFLDSLECSDGAI